MASILKIFFLQTFTLPSSSDLTQTIFKNCTIFTAIKTAAQKLSKLLIELNLSHD